MSTRFPAFLSVIGVSIVILHASPTDASVIIQFQQRVKSASTDSSSPEKQVRSSDGRGRRVRPSHSDSIVSESGLSAPHHFKGDFQHVPGAIFPGGGAAADSFGRRPFGGRGPGTLPISGRPQSFAPGLFPVRPAPEVESMADLIVSVGTSPQSPPSNGVSDNDRPFDFAPEHWPHRPAFPVVDGDAGNITLGPDFDSIGLPELDLPGTPLVESPPGLSLQDKLPTAFPVGPSDLDESPEPPNFAGDRGHAAPPVLSNAEPPAWLLLVLGGLGVIAIGGIQQRLNSGHRERRRQRVCRP